MSVQTVSLTPNNTSNYKTNQLKMNFPYPFDAKDYEIALSSAFIYYSWRNITSSYGNNTVAYTFNGFGVLVTFPDGFYSISDISAFIQLTMKNNGHYLIDSNGNYVYFISLLANSVYYRTTLTCTTIPSILPAGWTNPAAIVLSGNCPILIIINSPFGNLLGFTMGLYPPVTQTTTYQVNSNLIPQISPVTTINVACNMVNDSKFNIYPQTIFTFSPNVTYGGQIILQPQSLLWYRVVDGFYPYIDIQLRDQNNSDLPVLDTNMVMNLVIRKRSES